MSVEVEKEMLNAIFAARDEEYADFTAKLIPNVPRESIIGVRRSSAALQNGSGKMRELTNFFPHCRMNITNRTLFMHTLRRA